MLISRNNEYVKRSGNSTERIQSWILQVAQAFCQSSQSYTELYNSRRGSATLNPLLNFWPLCSLVLRPQGSINSLLGKFNNGHVNYHLFWLINQHIKVISAVHSAVAHFSVAGPIVWNSLSDELTDDIETVVLGSHWKHCFQPVLVCPVH